MLIKKSFSFQVLIPQETEGQVWWWCYTTLQSFSTISLETKSLHERMHPLNIISPVRDEQSSVKHISSTFHHHLHDNRIHSHNILQLKSHKRPWTMNEWEFCTPIHGFPRESHDKTRQERSQGVHSFDFDSLILFIDWNCNQDEVRSLLAVMS